MLYTRCITVLFAMSLFACGDDVGGVDLSTPDRVDHGIGDLPVSPDQDGPPDLLKSDFSTPTDLGDWCQGTALAGSCAYAYFVQYALCWHPAGACYAFGTNSLEFGVWDNCAQWTLHNGLGGNRGDVYAADGAVCMSAMSHSHDTPAAPQHFDIQIGLAKLDYDATTGIIKCPGGVESNIGANWGDCAALNALRDGNAAVAACHETSSPQACGPLLP